MVLQEKDLIKIGGSTSDMYIIRHIVAGVQLYTNVNMPSKTLLQTLDPLGNVKTSQEYEGFKGFWDASKEFEKLIEERLDLEEIINYQVGDVVFIDKPIGNLKKGDAIAITEISPDGLKIKKFMKLDKQSLDKIKKSPLVKKLIKSEWSDFLSNQGINSLDDLEPNTLYDFGLSPMTTIFIPPTVGYKGVLMPNNRYDINTGSNAFKVLLQNLVLDTNNDGKTELKAKVEFEDGSDGVLPLSTFENN